MNQYADVKQYVGAALGQAQSDSQPKANYLTNHEHQLHHLLKVASELHCRADALADRLIGSEPTPLSGSPQNGAVTSAEPPVMRRLDAIATEIQHVLNRAHEQLSRLERL